MNTALDVPVVSVEPQTDFAMQPVFQRQPSAL